MMRVGMLGLALLSCHSVVATAAPISAVRAQSKAEAALAVILDSDLPIERTIDENMKSFDRQIATMNETPEMVQFEARYPGILAEVRTDLHAKALGVFRNKMVPQLRARVASFYRENLNDGELEELADFYRTPTGVKLNAAARAGTERGIAAADASNGDDVKATINAGFQQGMAAASQALTSEDVPVLNKFNASTAGVKMNHLVAERKQLYTTFVTDFIRDNGPTFEAAAIDSLKRGLAARAAQSKSTSK